MDESPASPNIGEAETPDPSDTKPANIPPLNAFAGRLMAAMLVLSLVSGLVPAFPAWPAGVVGWLAGFLVWQRLQGPNRIQAVLLVLTGLAGLAFAASRGTPINVIDAIARNHALLAMLVAVSFLRLVYPIEDAPQDDVPRGRSALLKTLLGVHLFGAVINMSSIAIVGDRLSKGGKLDRISALVLSRGFSSAALWSPFFVAMAVALVYAPGARLPVLIVAGLPLALIALLLTYRNLRAAEEVRDGRFRGYPMNFQALWLPGMLAVVVLLAHWAFPTISVLTVITVLAPVTAIAVVLRRYGPAKGADVLRDQMDEQLPAMASELLLFLAAGVLATGLVAVFSVSNGWLPFARFDGATASALLLVMVGLAVVGVHPVITVSAAAPLLLPLVPQPDLLGIVFLMAWSLGVASSPLSGLHLMLQGRYGIQGWRCPRWNLAYSGAMLAVCIVALHIYAGLLMG